MKEGEQDRFNEEIQDRHKRTFLEFMEERRAVDRWFVIKISLAGAFMGALITVAFMVVSFGIWFQL